MYFVLEVKEGLVYASLDHLRAAGQVKTWMPKI